MIVHLARSAETPSPQDAVAHVVPAQELYGLASGWLREPRATLLIRTAVDQAQLLRAPHEARVMIKLAPHGLLVESPDAVEVEDFAPAQAVSGHDTVPMAPWRVLQEVGRGRCGSRRLCRSAVRKRPMEPPVDMKIVIVEAQGGRVGALCRSLINLFRTSMNIT